MVKTKPCIKGVSPTMGVGCQRRLGMKQRNSKQLAQALPTAWGEWLTHFEWNHFTTLTFKNDPTILRTSQEFTKFIRRLEQRAQRPVYWFKATETGRFGRLHTHALTDC